MSNKAVPSMDEWLREAKADANAEKCGMYLFHNGVVRETPRSMVRYGESDARPVTGMYFSCDEEKVNAAVEAARRLPGIFYVRVWLGSGKLRVGDDIMLVLIGGDIRPRVADALNKLVGELKNNCVTENEIF